MMYNMPTGKSLQMWEVHFPELSVTDDLQNLAASISYKL
jgi:hypothetical protein